VGECWSASAKRCGAGAGRIWSLSGLLLILHRRTGALLSQLLLLRLDGGGGALNLKQFSRLTLQGRAEAFQCGEADHQHSRNSYDVLGVRKDRLVFGGGENVLFAAVPKVAFGHSCILGVVQQIANRAGIPRTSATTGNPFGIECVGDALQGGS